MHSFETFIQTKAGLFVFFWILFCIAVEIIFTIKAGKELKSKERISSFTISIFGPLLVGKIFYYLLMNAAFIYVYQNFALFKIPLNTIWSWILFIVIADFFTYVIHRLEHRVRLFWCSHEVHHSATEMTVETSIRTSPLAAVYGSVIRLGLPFIGFHPIMHHTETLYSIVLSALNHNTHIGKLRWLDKLFNTPANHRAHHSSNISYLDKNYGSMLMIWDHLFGTYKAEGNEPLKFGIVKPRTTLNPLKLMTQPYLELWKDVRNAGNFSTALKYIFNPPGWHPDASKDTTAKRLQQKKTIHSLASR